MATFDTQLHTIYLLIGPTSCGKTHFSKNILIQSLSKLLKDNNIDPNIQHISSDDIRRQLLNNSNLNKYDMKMIEVSFQAFNTLYTYLDNVTQFPVNCHFAIVDTTGLNKEFRQNIINIAIKNHYNIEAIIFNFKDFEDYYRYRTDKKIIGGQIKKLREYTLKEISKEFDRKHYIRDHKTQHNFIIKELTMYKQCILDSNKKYLVIGDVHECVDEVKKMLIDFGFIIENNLIKSTAITHNCGIVFVGDLIDNGNKTKETIEFFHTNLTNKYVEIKLINGNHDNTVAKLLIGKQKEESF